MGTITGTGRFSFKELLGFRSFFQDPVRLGMQIASGRVRRKTEPTGPGVQEFGKKMEN